MISGRLTELSLHPYLQGELILLLLKHLVVVRKKKKAQKYSFTNLVVKYLLNASSILPVIKA